MFERPENYAAGMCHEAVSAGLAQALHARPNGWNGWQVA